VRLSKQVIGFAVAVAFATGWATTASALAFPNGTQIEYKQVSANTTMAARAIRTFAFELVLGELLAAVL